MSADPPCSSLFPSSIPPTFPTLIWRCPWHAAGLTCAVGWCVLPCAAHATRRVPRFRKSRPPTTRRRSAPRSTTSAAGAALRLPGGAHARPRSQQRRQRWTGPTQLVCPRALAAAAMFLAFTPGPSCFVVLEALRTRITLLQGAVPPRLVQRPWIPTPVPSKRGGALAEGIASGGQRQLRQLQYVTQPESVHSIRSCVRTVFQRQENSTSR